MAALIALLAAELIVRYPSPQEPLFPRWRYSAEYGFFLPPNSVVIHEMPGRWRFVYTLNDNGHRGELPPVSDRYETPNIVYLGDSYTLGVGVNDGEEFTAIMGCRLAGRYRVLNLASSGWVLTQQIRHYYELGELYQPSAVVL